MTVGDELEMVRVASTDEGSTREARTPATAMKIQSSPSDPRCAGFTLIEMMAVMVILAILITFLAFRLGGFSESVKSSTTEGYLQLLSGAISAFETETGDYPPSAWKSEWGPTPNKTNLGGEILCLTLWAKDAESHGLSDDKFCNTDEDEATKSLTRHQNNDLFELGDPWGNPTAYFHRRDYGRPDQYQTIDNETDAWIDSTVKALINPMTGNPFNPDTFQLISAGEDGVFGTDDDLTNFNRGREE